MVMPELHAICMDEGARARRSVWLPKVFAVHPGLEQRGGSLPVAKWSTVRGLSCS